MSSLRDYQPASYHSQCHREPRRTAHNFHIFTFIHFYIPHPFFTSFTHASFSVTVRLKISLSGVLSVSTQK